MKDVYFSDHFKITYDNNGILTLLEPDSINPEMKNYKHEEFLKLFIQDEMDLFRKINHIPKILWLKFGSILTYNNNYDYIIIAFEFRFFRKLIIKSIKISRSLIAAI